MRMWREQLETTYKYYPTQGEPYTTNSGSHRPPNPIQPQPVDRFQLVDFPGPTTSESRELKADLKVRSTRWDTEDKDELLTSSEEQYDEQYSSSSSSDSSSEDESSISCHSSASSCKASESAPTILREYDHGSPTDRTGDGLSGGGARTMIVVKKVAWA